MMKFKYIQLLVFTILGCVSMTAQVSKSPSFILQEERIVDRLLVNSNYFVDDKLLLEYGKSIDGLAIGGRVDFNNEDGFIRITLEDMQGNEYLVYETYPLLSGNYYEEFKSVAMESSMLNNIKPYCLNISVFHANLFLQDIVFSKISGYSFNKEDSNLLREKQQEELLLVLNRNIMEKKQPWFAGKTSVSMKSFEEKKKKFGGVVPFFYGFEYYKGGVFTFSPKYERKSVQHHKQTNQYVRDFDWRNRHGKNWITSVKEQIYNTCWAFASTATIESNLNIYYNRLLNYDLSEQELISCLDNDGLTINQRLNQGGYSMYALDYVKNHSIVKEECFPFTGAVSCNSKCVNPSEQISFSSFRNLKSNNCLDSQQYIYNDSISDALRKTIIKHPVLVDYFKLGGHSISCVGFHQIQLGDTLCANINTSYFFVVDSSTCHFVDEISWIIKNSWGDDWG